MRSTLLLVAISYVIGGLISLVNETLSALSGYQVGQHQTIDLLQPVFAKESWAASDWIYVLFIILSAVGIAPFLEEVTFRLFLRYRLQNILVSLSLQFFFFLNVTEIVTERPLLLASTVFFFTLAGGAAVWFVKRNLYEIYVSQWWSRQFPLIYYYSAVVFGWMHMTAYGLEGNALWLGPIVLTPIVVMGLVLGFVRIRYGIWYAMLAHGSINIAGIITIVIAL